MQLPEFAGNLPEVLSQCCELTGQSGYQLRIDTGTTRIRHGQIMSDGSRQRLSISTPPYLGVCLTALRKRSVAEHPSQ